MEKQNMITEEQFRAFCKVALPHVNELIGELKKLGHHGMASFSIADDGYFSFSIHNTGWSMGRLDEEGKARMRKDYQEAVEE